MMTSQPPTTRPHADSEAESGRITLVSPPALTLTLSQGERGQDAVSIEAVERREATVRDFVASRFDTPPAAPKGRRGLVRKLRRIAGSLLRRCRRLEAISPRGLQATAKQRLTITYYYPWGCFHPIRSGAGAVASRHLDYFRQRGHRVRMMVRAASFRGRVAFERHYHWVDDLAVVDLDGYPDAQSCFDRWDFGSYLAGHARLAEQPDIAKWLSQPADLAFINYVFATPLLDALPAGAYRMLETYDIMSHQFLQHGGPSALLERSLAGEFDLYRLYDSVLMINPEEAELAEPRCPAHLTYMPPAVDVAPEGSESTDDEEYDLLFVGSDHPPNVEGVNWFYDRVYRPLLKPKGLRWAICGSVGRQLPFKKDPGVTCLGPVADLGAVYRRSKVVVVPLFRGSGVSIKTLEAMGHRKPVVTTPCGRRGLPASADDALITLRFEDGPAAVAEAIRTFCSAKVLREDYGRRAATCVGDHFSSRAYGRRMDRIFATVAAGRGAMPVCGQGSDETREAV
jgi:glycosyltransferase involved in cell wall biosynthesis